MALLIPLLSNSNHAFQGGQKRKMEDISISDDEEDQSPMKYQGTILHYKVSADTTHSSYTFLL